MAARGYARLYQQFWWLEVAPYRPPIASRLLPSCSPERHPRFKLRADGRIAVLESPGTAAHILARQDPVLRVTRHECRTSLLMNIDRSYEADQNPSAMVTLTLSCSP